MTPGGMGDRCVTDQDVQDIMSKLCFIAKIKKGEKINVTNLTLVEDTWYNNLLRTISPVDDSRDASLEFIRKVSERALDQADYFLGSTELFRRNVGVMILNALKEVGIGVTNLMTTYQSDRMYVAQIETFQRLLAVKISDIEYRYPR